MSKRLIGWNLGAVTALALFSCLLAAPVMAQTGTLFVENDKVGIGVPVPQTELDIQSQASNANVTRILSTDGNILFRVFEMAGGDGLISLFNHVGAETFRFTSAGGGRIAVGCRANLTSDIEINDGSGPSSACGAGTWSRIDAAQTQFTTSSSRTIKENLAPIQADGILDKVSRVGVYNYDFIDGPIDRIGLMAEDFHTVFERGAETELNGHEVQMALWLAVQELASRTDELARRNGELAAENDELRRALESLAAGDD